MGSIRNRVYEDRNGVRHKTFEINADKVTFLIESRVVDTTDTLLLRVRQKLRCNTFGDPRCSGYSMPAPFNFEKQMSDKYIKVINILKDIEALDEESQLVIWTSLSEELFTRSPS